MDHGKTSLVRCLTGQETDRLEEEKRRGLTIDLGFAYITGDDDADPIGFVDVPGHHRFIHNMVAGVASMQYALMVVAADDGPMPQSREHLQILELLGISAGAIALTKCDRVDPFRLGEAEHEIRELASHSFLADAPIFRTSAATGEGIPELLDHLRQVNDDFRVDQPPRCFRLAVDRAFNVRGSGLIVTGTVHAGSVVTDEELAIFPAGVRARVRGIRTQSRHAAEARAGDRCALNLSGVSLDQVGRGSWLSSSNFTGSRNVALRLKVVADFPRTVGHWTPVHVYHATSHVTGRIALLDRDALAPNDSCLADLVLDEPLLAIHGDRLVLRDQSLDRTLGGGMVLHNARPEGRRRAPARLSLIDAFANPTPEACFAQAVREAPLSLDEFQGCWNLLPGHLDRIVEASKTRVHDGFAVAESLWREWAEGIVEEVGRRHVEQASLQGLKANQLGARVPDRFKPEVLRELAAAGKLVQRAGHYLPAEHDVALSNAETRLLDSIANQLDQRQPPSVGDLAKQIGMPVAELKRQLQPLAGKRRVVRVSDARYYLPAPLSALVEVVDRLSSDGPFTVREFRDAADIGRNVAIEVLEYLDGRGYTKRQGDVRVVVGDVSRVMAP
ncbi:MAG: selenocysteine-specific translation elongation factor [Pseudomonadales bacterium]|nr:selenocysteine-specific translation elongation factor [Pseudomonadales bacterium]NIX07675.1 selenocysteine-specific translation elongation factor [Pseudomonadales bacterium]